MKNALGIARCWIVHVVCSSLLVVLWATQTALEAAAAIAESEAGGDDSEASPELREAVSKSLEGFDAGMNDDLNTPRWVRERDGGLHSGKTITPGA